MKVIFDFDDVLFYNTKLFKEHMYSCLEKAGVPRDESESFYKETRGERKLHGNQFSLKGFIATLLEKKEIKTVSGKKIYEDILGKIKNSLNTELIEIVKKVGKDNCYLVSNGDIEYQADKVRESGIEELFREFYPIPGTKKEIVEEICQRHKDEPVIFIDDRPYYFEDLDMEKCKNLKTVLYDENGLEKVCDAIKSAENI